MNIININQFKVYKVSDMGCNFSKGLNRSKLQHPKIGGDVEEYQAEASTGVRVKVIMF